MSATRRTLCIALFALAALYGWWFRQAWVALAVFAVPPLWLALALARGAGARVAFWAGVLALAWFAHGVMVAWTRPSDRAFALVETALAVLVVFAASLPGLRARFGKRG